MEITSSLSLMDGKYKKGSFSEVQVVNGQEVTVDLSDLPLIQLPKTQFSVGATQTVPMGRSEEHTSELQSLMRISYAVFCLKKKKQKTKKILTTENTTEDRKTKLKAT